MKKTRIFALCIVIVLIAVFALTFAACDKKESDKFSIQTTFALDNESTNLMGFSGVILDIIEPLILNMDNTYFQFNTDGTLHAQLQTSSNLFDNLPAVLRLLGGSSDANIGDVLGTINLSYMLKAYVEPMFPGFTAELVEGDLNGALALIKASLGFNITGLDTDTNEDLRDAVKYIGQTKYLPSNLLDVIPHDTVLTLTFDTQYSIRTLVGNDGTTYTGIYLGYAVKDNLTTQPFAILTVGAKDGVKTLSLCIEFMNITIGLIEKA